jgi:ATP adenylyltransferase
MPRRLSAENLAPQVSSATADETWDCDAPRIPRRDQALYTGLNSALLRSRHATMDHLWTPWRYAYVTATDGAPRPGVPLSLAAWPGDLGCVFCNLIASIDHAIGNGMKPEEAEAAGGLILRAKYCFICLNAYPYTSGHVMVVPYAHLDRLSALPVEAAHELMDLAQRTELALQKLYNPHGFNFGLNIGKAGGAGVAGHLHLHALPRWAGDTNFMTTVAESRVLPEELDITWKRMREAFASKRSL